MNQVSLVSTVSLALAKSGDEVRGHGRVHGTRSVDYNIDSKSRQYPYLKYSGAAHTLVTKHGFFDCCLVVEVNIDSINPELRYAFDLVLCPNGSKELCVLERIIGVKEEIC